MLHKDDRYSSETDGTEELFLPAVFSLKVQQTVGRRPGRLCGVAAVACGSVGRSQE